MSVIVCFRWQCVFLYVLVAKRVLGSFKWRCVLLGLLGGIVSSWVF